MRYYLPVILIALTVLVSCQQKGKQPDKLTEKVFVSEDSVGKDFTGIKKTYFEDGKVRSAISYKKGIKDGVSTNYYRDGKINAEFSFKDGIENGPVKWYYKNGQLYQHKPFKNGYLDGIMKEYHKDGKLKTEIPYKDGREGIGLKEYSVKGTLYTDYPEIVIKTENRLMHNNEYLIKLTSSRSNWTDVQFYEGKLTDGKYLNYQLMPIRKENGVATLRYELKPGREIMERLNFVMKVKTAYGHYYIAQKDFPLVLEHPNRY